MDKALKESLEILDYLKQKGEAVAKIVQKYKTFEIESTKDVLEKYWAKVEVLKEHWDDHKPIFERNEEFRKKYKPTQNAIVKMAKYLRKCSKVGLPYKGSKEIKTLVEQIVQNTLFHFIKDNGPGSVPVSNKGLFIEPDDIEFKHVIGQGSFGQVYLGLYNGAMVALKYTTNMPREEFVKEITLMSNIKPHPNIVQLYGHTFEKSTKAPIIVLEYCSNGSIEEYRRKNGPFDTKDLISKLHNIALGMVHLHQAGIVHRDLGARNILLSKDVCKISDFGMSKLIDTTTETSSTVARPVPIPWMAPEVFNYQQDMSKGGILTNSFTPKADVWGFGIVVYELLTGKEPHPRGNEQELAVRIRDEGLTPEIPENCPELLRRVMLACWQKEPTKRPTMKEVSRMLNPDLEASSEL